MVEADGSVTAAPLGFVLSAAARKLAKYYAAALADRPISPSQLVVLRWLWRDDGLTLRELAPMAGLDPTSLNWIADKLEGSGFVERRRDELDRRSVRLWLTADGRRAEADLTPELRRWESTINETLGHFYSTEDLETFRAVLQTLVDILPEGEDLWAKAGASWKDRLLVLRDYLEGAESAGESGD